MHFSPARCYPRFWPASGISQVVKMLLAGLTLLTFLPSLVGKLNQKCGLF
jgi:hypothetical protein